MNIPRLLKKIDYYLGSFICICLLPISFFRKKELAGDPRSILLIKLWAIGESVLTLPLLDALHKNYPHARINVLVQKQNFEIFTGQPFVHSILYFNLQSSLKLLTSFRKIDLVIDAEPFFKISALLAFWMGRYTLGFNHGIRSLLYDKKIQYNDKQHIVQTYLDIARSLGINMTYKTLIPLCYTSEDRQSVDKLLKECFVTDSESLVGIAPGSGVNVAGRRWHWKNYLELSQKIINNFGYKIILVGDQKDTNITKKITTNNSKMIIDFAGKISLKQLFYFMKRLKLFISNDSGPMHVAAAQSVRTIGLFGPETPIRFSPYGPGNYSFYKRQGPPLINVHKGEWPRDDDPAVNSAMESISVQEVFQKVKEFLG